MSSAADLRREYRRGYSNGFRAGRKNHWPEHLGLPTPPRPLVAELLEAAREIRDVADTYCATTVDDCELAQEFNPKIDRYDKAVLAISDWLTKGDEDVQR